MWVSKQLLDLIVADNKDLTTEGKLAHGVNERLIGEQLGLRSQKVRDDITIDWMRHRINALEKEKALMFAKLAGIAIPVPEIVPTRPGSISGLPMDFHHTTHFEDVGDQEAVRLGVTHDENGLIQFKE